jgi:hypothetical protein
MFKIGDLVTPIQDQKLGWYRRGLIIAEVLSIDIHSNPKCMTIAIILQSSNAYFEPRYLAQMDKFKILYSKP